MRFLHSFAIPTERAVREIEVDARREERLPKNRYLHTLRNRISRDECSMNICPSHILRRFFVPARDIIEIANIFPAFEHRLNVIFLCCIHHTRPDKRRVAHNFHVVARRQNLPPVDAQRVRLVQIRIRRQRQEAHLAVQDFFRLPCHLTLRDPERRFRDRAGEVLDFDAVELADRHLDESPVVCAVEIEAEHARAAFCHDRLAQDIIFEPPEGEVTFSQEIPAAAGRVKIFAAPELFLQIAQFL